MKTGNPKQAMVLGAVALVVVMMAVVRVIPSGSAEPNRVAASEAATPEEHADAALEPIATQELSNDPFSHPELIKDEQDPSNRSSPTEDQGGDQDRQRPEAEWKVPYREGFEPYLPELRPEGKPYALGDDMTGTDESTGKSQESQEAPKPKRKLMLEAIVNAGDAQAFISLDGQAGRYGLADKIGGLGTIVFLNDEKVVILSGSKKITLQVGREVEI